MALSSNIKVPDLRDRLGPVLPSLPPAALSVEVSDTILPFLSPILRQRVQLLSASSTEPWIGLLCYDPAKVPKLSEIAQSNCLEPHPVSGEVEVDWDYDAETRYRRVDEETLQALVALQGFGLSFRLVYCAGDPMGGDGWRVGEVSVVDTPSAFSSFGGVSTIEEAERQFNESKTKNAASATGGSKNATATAEDNDDDDDYWARYDATPARTPAAQRSPAPGSTNGRNTGNEEEDYYAQYDSVQPAMDNHDPDEEVNMPDIAPPLGLSSRSTHPAHDQRSDEEVELNETNGAWTLADSARSPSASPKRESDPSIAHPRPSSSASSNASVEKLEAAAENFGVQQHISRSIKSLFMLSRASGIERADFERIVKTELDMLGLMEY
ncbi:uncharacterized protein BCR38DRAFT_168341 [Pseudomassariella vexata]|uniref:Uncharacterized protein n=1 Tax=Pseudomassariella vexata TaxID=1141098 RepID=A0A1Y2E360_9PEZI|nr:uncharacterized protein BCR38DRAFT_168341 [Pseudomassariella vexata]ORY65887.1 hypothetical protein BCR38DRAFT_168341 [Pseudomassariella vexata]